MIVALPAIAAAFLMVLTTKEPERGATEDALKVGDPLIQLHLLLFFFLVVVVRLGVCSTCTNNVYRGTCLHWRLGFKEKQHHATSTF